MLVDVRPEDRLTQTARVHNAAWTETFDTFLRERAVETGEPFRAFDPGADYNTYVDGKPRDDLWLTALVGERDTTRVLAVPAGGGRTRGERAVQRGHPLLELARESDVLWLTDDAEADRLPGEVAALLVDDPGLVDTVDVEVLHGSYDVPGARLLDLVTVMDELRRSCPWDQEQTHESLARYLLEEAYETLEAIEAGDHTHLREELGDLLLQVYFHARIAAESDPEEGGFTIDDVAGGIVDKLVHRHPHVFAGLDVAKYDADGKLHRIIGFSGETIPTA